ncbi:MAG TPA: HEAT repeat domain-containing protein [Ignavibacteria bacterium]|nr:HEAT repeat domain-containing protein [Ignavibacteria bacterium]
MDKINSEPEDLEVKKLIECLCCDDGMERKKAREELVAKGKNIVDFLMELLNNPKHIYRWEALKTMEEIGDPISIPMFIKALEDDESDVRWIAAEGLIKLGMKSIKPLLKTLIEKSGSIFVLAGIHHVFYDLKKIEELPAGFPIDKLLSALKDPECSENIRPMAYELLNNFES